MKGGMERTVAVIRRGWGDLKGRLMRRGAGQIMVVVRRGWGDIEGRLMRRGAGRTMVVVRRHLSQTSRVATIREVSFALSDVSR